MNLEIKGCKKCESYVIDSTLKNLQNPLNILNEEEFKKIKSKEIENISNDFSSKDELEIIDYPYEKFNTFELKYDRNDPKKSKKINMLPEDSSSSIISDNNEYNIVCNSDYNKTLLVKNPEININEESLMSKANNKINKAKSNIKKRFEIQNKSEKNKIRLRSKNKLNKGFELNLAKQSKMKNKNNFFTIKLFKNEKSNLLTNINDSNEKQRLKIYSLKTNKLQSNISKQKNSVNEKIINTPALARFNNFTKKMTNERIRSNNHTNFLKENENRSKIFNSYNEKTKILSSLHKVINNPFIKKCEYVKHTQKNSGLMNKYINKIISKNVIK